MTLLTWWGRSFGPEWTQKRLAPGCANSSFFSSCLFFRSFFSFFFAYWLGRAVIRRLASFKTRSIHQLVMQRGTNGSHEEMEDIDQALFSPSLFLSLARSLVLLGSSWEENFWPSLVGLHSDDLCIISGPQRSQGTWGLASSDRFELFRKTFSWIYLNNEQCLRWQCFVFRQKLDHKAGCNDYYQ